MPDSLLCCLKVILCAVCQAYSYPVLQVILGQRIICCAAQDINAPDYECQAAEPCTSVVAAGNLAVDDYDMGSGSEDSAVQHLDSHSEHSSDGSDVSESPQPEAGRVQPKRNAARNKGSLREPPSQDDIWLVEGGELA